MGTFEEQVARLAAGEVEPGEPVVEPTPEPGPNAQVEGQPVIPDPPTAEPPQQAAPAEEPVVPSEPSEPQEPDPLLQGIPGNVPLSPAVTKRINKAIFQREEARREAEYWRRVASGEVQKPAPAPIASAPVIQFPKPQPKIEDFQNEADPYAALAFAAGRYEAEKIQHENQTRAFQAQQQAQLNQQEQLVQAKMAEGEAKYPDFYEATDELGKQVTPAMREALFDSPRFADLAYHLSHDPAEVQRIARLTPLAQVRELGKLEDKLAVQTANPSAKQVARQPTPVQSAGQGLPTTKPNTAKLFEAAKQGGSLRDWTKYLEQTETFQP
jgi:hypothetical protein